MFDTSLKSAADRAAPTHRHRDAHEEDADQTRESPATDGAATDGRYGAAAEEMVDIAGTIVRMNATRGGTHLTISAGRAQGVHLGMEGQVRGGATAIANFTVDSVGKTSCTATVHVNLEALHGHAQVVINPSAREAVATDHTATIMRVTVHGERSRIVLSGGTAQGLSEGMAGYLVGDPASRFTLEEVDARSSVAFVDKAPDFLQQHPKVVVNPRH